MTMGHDTGSLSPGDRLCKLEELHEPGGACEDQRCKLWDAMTSLRERVKALEIKLLIGGAVLGVLGPLAAQWIFKRMGG